MYLGDVAADPFPKRVWTSCGVGFEVTEAGFVPGSPIEGLSYALTTFDERNGEIYLRLTEGAPWLGEVSVVSRLSDGATLAALQIRNFDCSLWGWSSESALWFIVHDNGGEASRGGHVALEPGAPVVWSKWFVTQWGLAATDFGNDEMFGISDGLIRGAAVGDEQLTRLDVGDVFEMAATGRLALWVGYSGRRVLKGFVPGSTSKVMWQGQAPLEVVAVGASDKFVVWSVMDGFNAEGYRFDHSWLYWQPNSGTNDTLADPRIIELPFNGGLHEIRTGGDYVATHASIEVDGGEADHGIRVFRLSTGEMWTIRPRPGNGFMSDVMAISDTDLVVAEVADTGFNSVLPRILRYRLDQLDQIATRGLR